MQAPINVLLWSPKGAGLHYGGPGMSAFRLYSRANPQRLRVTLVHGFSAQSQEPVFVEQRFLSEISNGPLSQINFVRNSISWLRQNASRFDVFHGLQAFHLTVRPALEAEKLGLPAVVKVAGHRAELADKPGWRSLFGLPKKRRQWLRDRISAVIAISKDIASELLEYGIPEEKIVEIPNGVDTELFRPGDESEKKRLREEFCWPDTLTILFVGQLNRRKRPDLLFQALRILLDRGLDCQLVIAGPDGEREYVKYLRDLIVSLRLRSRVHWMGFTDNVAPLYRASDVFALISENEGMPNALLEAMASGLPAVVTRISGTRDLVSQNQTGLFVDPDPHQVAEALAWLIDNEQEAKRYGESARNLVLRRFSAKVVLAAHEELFSRLKKGKCVNST